MSPQNNSPEMSQQGSLFETHLVESGATDPELATRHETFEATPDGFYEESPVADKELSEDNTAVQGVREAIAKKKRHDAQVGKHSPLERSGSYQNGLKVGDFLPRFGPVKYSNLDQAQRHAAQLDRERRQ